MDVKLIKSRLQEAKRELETLNERQDALAGLVKSYETLLRLEGGTEIEETSPMLPLHMASGRGGASKGTISLSKAILVVLRSAQGAALHTKEVLPRALALGAVTEAKNPQGAIDLVCYHLAQDYGGIEKVGPRKWRWTGSGTSWQRYFKDEIEAASPNGSKSVYAQ